MKTNRNYEDLPILYIELFLNDIKNKLIEGKAHPSNEYENGIYLICEPIDELSLEIKDILKTEDNNYPFEYYSISFKTFAGQSYTGYRKFVKHLLIDNSKISNEYATKSYIKTVYESYANDIEKNKFLNKYRDYKKKFTEKELSSINKKIFDYNFEMKSNTKCNFETDLTIAEDGIDIENKGMGKQCFIRTKFALQKAPDNLDIILLEEPENHLSHTNMQKLIQYIKNSESSQIILTTHNNLITSRLNLQKTIFLNSNSNIPFPFDFLESDTAKFFMKAPNSNILEFIMSKKVILVEGDAEYILMKQFYSNIIGKAIENSDIHIISVGGTSFKRYLQIAKKLKIKTAIIRDNDHDYKKNIEESFAEYVSDSIKIFSDGDNKIYIFEVAIFNSNTDICNELFKESTKTLSIINHMLKNKTEAAFKLLEKKGSNLIPPQYIKEAIEWINN